MKKGDFTAARVGRKKIQNSNIFRKTRLSRLSPLRIYPNITLHVISPPPQHNLKFSYSYYRTHHTFLSSLVSVISFPGSLGSSSQMIKLLKFTRGTNVYNSSHYNPLLQRVPWTSKIREVSSVMPSLRTQKLSGSSSHSCGLLGHLGQHRRDSVR